MIYSGMINPGPNTREEFDRSMREFEKEILRAKAADEARYQALKDACAAETAEVAERTRARDARDAEDLIKSQALRAMGLKEYSWS